MTKRLMLAATAALFGTAMPSTTVAAPQKASDPAVKPHTKTVTIPIKGMACQQMCGTRVAKTLKAIDGVEKVTVSAAEGNARVTYVEAKVKPEHLAAAVTKLGFEAGSPKTSQ